MKILQCLLSFFLLSLLLNLVAASNAGYYREYPALISKALLQCPALPPKDMSCQALSHLAKETADLMLELEQNPQKFGLNIMVIQVTIAQQKLWLQTSTEPSKRNTLSQHLKQTQQNLTLRLALIRSLESPEGLG